MPAAKGTCVKMLSGQESGQINHSIKNRCYALFIHYAGIKALMPFLLILVFRKTVVIKYKTYISGGNHEKGKY